MFLLCSSDRSSWCHVMGLVQREHRTHQKIAFFCHYGLLLYRYSMNWIWILWKLPIQETNSHNSHNKYNFCTSIKKHPNKFFFVNYFSSSTFLAVAFNDGADLSASNNVCINLVDDIGRVSTWLTTAGYWPDFHPDIWKTLPGWQWFPWIQVASIIYSLVKLAQSHSAK